MTTAGETERTGYRPDRITCPITCRNGPLDHAIRADLVIVGLQTNGCIPVGLESRRRVYAKHGAKGLLSIRHSITSAVDALAEEGNPNPPVATE